MGVPMSDEEAAPVEPEQPVEPEKKASSSRAP